MLNRDVSLGPMPVTPPGQPVFVYGVIVHRTGARPPPSAGTNHPSSRTPSDILTAISRQPAADAGAAQHANNASTTNGSPLRTPIAHNRRWAPAARSRFARRDRLDTDNEGPRPYLRGHVPPPSPRPAQVALRPGRDVPRRDARV